MTQLILMIAIEVILAGIGFAGWWKVRRLCLDRDMLAKKFNAVAEKFNQHINSMTQSSNEARQLVQTTMNLYKDTAAELEYEKKAFIRLCEVHKKLQTAMEDKTVQYNHLAQQYNSLLSKMQQQQSPSEGA